MGTYLARGAARTTGSWSRCGSPRQVARSASSTGTAVWPPRWNSAWRWRQPISPPTAPGMRPGSTSTCGPSTATANRTRFEQAGALFSAKQAGATRSRIRKTTGLQPTQVTAALAAAGLSGGTRDAVQDLPHELTLEELGILAEFEDGPQALTALLDTARWGGALEHQAERVRQQRAEAAERDHLCRELEQAGHAITPTLPATVRKRWLATSLFPRRAAPREVARFVARQLLAMPGPLRGGLSAARMLVLFAEVTGQPAGHWQEACGTAAPGRLPVLMVGPIATAYEHAMTEGEGRNTWRLDRYSPCPRQEAGRYLRFLASLGYQLSGVEQAVAGGQAWREGGQELVPGDGGPGGGLPGPARQTSAPAAGDSGRAGTGDAAQAAA